ncbi:hypothetical protein [Nonomuraea sp. NPDC050310]|uniref:hypothetical protein n=1 Tax=unclassified Nonomuraea TaxID=2593643 RepID=UPI0033D50819
MANNVIDLRPPGQSCGCPACERLSFPPVALAADAELAARVPTVPLVADAVALAAWTGSRAVDAQAMLEPADAAAAVAELGLRPERLRLLWIVAVNGGLLRITRERAEPGPFTFERGVESTLEFWDGVVMDVLDRADAEGLTGSAVLDEHLAETLATVYSVRSGVSAATLAKGILQSHEVACGPHTGGPILTELEAALELLAYCGLVERTAHGGVRLTPLGVWAIRQDLRREGHDAPSAAQVEVFAELDAAELVAAMVAGGVTPSAVGTWLERHHPVEAAWALTRIAAAGNAGERGACGTVLDELGPVAEPALRAALSEPLLWRYAASWLHIRDLDAPPLTPADHAWIAVDTLAALLYLSDAPGTLPSLDEDLNGLVGQMQQVDHPDTVAVLELLAAHHDDATVAKAARKAAMKARSLAARNL